MRGLMSGRGGGGGGSERPRAARLAANDLHEDELAAALFVAERHQRVLRISDARAKHRDVRREPAHLRAVAHAPQTDRAVARAGHEDLLVHRKLQTQNLHAHAQQQTISQRLETQHNVYYISTRSPIRV